MDQSANLRLPYIMAAQAQKHVTHNEAIRTLDAIVQLSVLDRDLAAPPVDPGDGDRYVVAASATGDWAGQDNSIAAYQDGAWMFYAPSEGWIAWVADEDGAVVFDGSDWVPLASGGGGGGATTFKALSDTPANFTGNASKLVKVNSGETALEFDDQVPFLGINVAPDATNKLKVSSDAVLLDHAGSDHRAVVNKNAAADIASFLFQTNYSGRAEIGLTGDDDFHFKVSPDGTTFHEAIVIDKDDGSVSFPNSSIGSGGATNLTVSRDGVSVTVESSTGTNAAIATADASNAGILTAAAWSKLDGISAGAQVNPNAGEIKTAYESNADTNAFTDALQSKLNGIEAGATADQSGGEIEALLDAHFGNSVWKTSYAVGANDEGLSVVSDLSALNFVGAGVTVTDGGSGVATVTIPGGGGGGSFAVEDEGAELTAVATKLNFIGAGVVATNSGNAVTVAISGSASGDVAADIRALAMNVSELKGDRISMPDGLFDPFGDESDIDTGGSSGATYDAQGQYYSNSAGSFSQISTTGMARIGSMTSNGGLDAAFDGQTAENTASSAYLNNVSAGTVGIDWGAGNSEAPAKATIHPATDNGFNNDFGTNLDIEIRGSNDGTTWTVLGSMLIADPIGATTAVDVTLNTSTAYRYHDARYSRSAGNVWPVCAELEFFDASSGDLTLVSTAFTAASTPTAARLTVQANPIDAIAINTDLIGSVSRDGGTTWTAATLAAETALADGTTLYVHDGLDISGQPSGTSMKWKVVTANNKTVQVNGIGLRWV